MAIADGVVRAGRGHCKNLKMSQQEIGDFTIKLVHRAPRHIHVCITNSRAREREMMHACMHGMMDGRHSCRVLWQVNLIGFA